MCFLPTKVVHKSFDLKEDPSNCVSFAMTTSRRQSATPLLLLHYAWHEAALFHKQTEQHKRTRGNHQSSEKEVRVRYWAAVRHAQSCPMTTLEKRRIPGLAGRQLFWFSVYSNQKLLTVGRLSSKAGSIYNGGCGEQAPARDPCYQSTVSAVWRNPLLARCDLGIFGYCWNKASTKNQSDHHEAIPPNHPSRLKQVTRTSGWRYWTSWWTWKNKNDITAGNCYRFLCKNLGITLREPFHPSKF